MEKKKALIYLNIPSMSMYQFHSTQIIQHPSLSNSHEDLMKKRGTQASTLIDSDRVRQNRPAHWVVDNDIKQPLFS